MNIIDKNFSDVTVGLQETEVLNLSGMPLDMLLTQAADLRDRGHGPLVGYSRKVFIPLTQLCRDVCHYCTFAKAPKKLEAAYLNPDQVLAIARAGQKAGCKEALFTLGDKPELRYSTARKALEKMGYASTIEYLSAMAELVFRETGLLPHLNPGVMNSEEIAALRKVSVSMGIMLESTSPRLLQKGGCHFGSPDKDPLVRLETIAEAGRQNVPFTSGILIGIGETRRERIESLLALRDLYERYGHLQEIIIQNFRAKPDTLMADAPEPDLTELQWTIAVARIIFGPEMNIQAPPNLSQGCAQDLIAAGINDWGGVSPVTLDHVNPEAPWPHLDDLACDTASAGKLLVERLGIYPAFAGAGQTWLDPLFLAPVLSAIDADGLVRNDEWTPGDALVSLPQIPSTPGFISDGNFDRALDKALNGDDLNEHEICRLFAARDGEVGQITQAADNLRQKVCGDTVSYVVTRNINYTNICYFKCRFCAFSKGKMSENLRGRPYDLSLEEITSRARDAWDRGAVEVCLQGGIHPKYTGQTYLDILHAIKSELPDMHVHAFSPLEIQQGAQTLDISIGNFLGRLIDAGLGSLPGTAAEILDDEVRMNLCPDKLNTAEWFEVIDTAHRLGLKSTATIMFGHIDQPEHWARHLLGLRNQQKRTGGFTELVPLPFVHMESPIYLKGRSRCGPTWRETLLMHSIARLVLHPHIPNIQTSWVKLGQDGVAACLAAGVNDLGGTLMDESITRSAGSEHGQEMTPESMEALLAKSGRPSRQRTTLYADAHLERRAASFAQKA
ncbi:MAG: 5-amino-6-(D-ribitylamino)uracil--L-tyrosine 4-hydroxyphenyl transferase CofH [Hyphomicrobiales bacterium]|nr:5-amino-6-(D-ribitylamino)uracil--L-tyrosine 4-hydroxyphenyl transferase CofH [Hyphomicrobiales bacterium]